MSSKPETLIVYHGNCVDGFTAAWCAHRQFQDTAEYVPMKNNGADFDVDGRDVFFLDCCPRRAQLLDFKARARSLVVLDHHITAFKECGDIEGLVFDMTKSGAGLAAERFRSFNSGEPFVPPKLVQYVQDQDLWLLKLPCTKEIRETILSETYDFLAWDRLAYELEDPEYFQGKIDEGGAILKCKRKEIDYLKTNAQSMDFLGHKNVPVVNMSHGDISLTLSELAQGAPEKFAVAWHQAGNGDFKYSLRSVDGAFDCAAFAREHFGGGGHVGAAGFAAPAGPWNYPWPKSVFKK